MRKIKKTIPLTVAVMTYNRSHWLQECLHAILNQTWRDFELLVCDNHSTDDTPAVVLGIKDDRIRYVRNPPGFMSGFNHATAVKMARGDRLIVTHDDDIMQPTMLEKLMAMMDRPGMVAAWSNYSVMDAAGKTISEYFTPPGADRIYGLGEYIARYTVEMLWPHPGTLIFRRDKTPFRKGMDRTYYIRNFGKKDPKIAGGFDILSPAMMNTHGSVAFINEPLLRYRQHGNQSSVTVDITSGIYHTYRELYRMSKKIPQTETSTPFLQNFMLRGRTYALLAGTRSHRIAASKITSLHKAFALATQDTKLPGEMYQPLLPVSILLSQIGQNASGLFDFHMAPGADQPRSVRSFHQWAMLRKQGRNLFDEFPPSKKIAILGSVMVAALLINEARERGLHVTCCFDSNASRHNDRLLGVPIYPPAQLASMSDSVDCVVLSSERENDPYLEQFLLGISKQVQVVPWKRLALAEE